MRKDAIFRVQTIIVISPVTHTGGQVYELIGGGAFLQFAADRQDKMDDQEGEDRPTR